MPRFGSASLAQLATCDPRLQHILNEAIKHFDFSVLEGHRGQIAQDAAYAKGFSTVRWPHSKHNVAPSRAVDIAPYPIDWSEKATAQQRFILLAGFILCISAQQGIAVRWGGDWNRNLDTRDEGAFRDLPHFELADP